MFLCENKNNLRKKKNNIKFRVECCKSISSVFFIKKLSFSWFLVQDLKRFRN